MNINYLKNKNPHKLDSSINFIEEGHIYTISDEPKISYTSVTTWIHSLFSKFDSDAIIKNMMNSKEWTNNKYYGYSSSEIKSIWETNRCKSAYEGTKLHNDIERFYNNLSISNETIEFKFFLDFFKDYSYLEPYRTEMLIFCKELRLAGAIDMLFKRDNDILEIYDWKRSKEIVKENKWNKWIISEQITYIPDSNFWHYALQLNTYKSILIKNYGFKIGDMYLIVLHPNNKSYKRLKVPNLQNEINLLFQERKCKITI